MSVEFKALALGPLETNCYLVWDKDSLEAAIIDPGADLSVIQDQINELGLSVNCVLLTHGHPDHCFEAANAAAKYSCAIAMDEADIGQPELLMPLLEMLYDVSSYVPVEPTLPLKEGDVLHLGGSPIEVTQTPGHSPGGVCFVTDAGVFCGDTIFAGGVGRTDFPGGDHGQLISSIRTKILVMKDETPLYPGHGPATTVGRERTTNSFLT